MAGRGLVVARGWVASWEAGIVGGGEWGLSGCRGVGRMGVGPVGRAVVGGTGPRDSSVVREVGGVSRCAGIVVGGGGGRRRGSGDRRVGGCPVERASGGSGVGCVGRAFVAGGGFVVVGGWVASPEERGSSAVADCGSSGCRGSGGSGVGCVGRAFVAGRGFVVVRGWVVASGKRGSSRRGVVVGGEAGNVGIRPRHSASVVRQRPGARSPARSASVVRRRRGAGRDSVRAADPVAATRPFG